MATSVANPQASAPGPQQGAGPDPSQQQANPLQQTLGQLVVGMRKLADKNVIIQPELQQVQSILIQALQKVSQASPGPAAQPSAPPQQ